MAAIFPIPYETEATRGVRGHAGTCTVLSLDAGRPVRSTRRPVHSTRRPVHSTRQVVRRRLVSLVGVVIVALVLVFGLGAVFAVLDSLSTPPAAVQASTRVGGLTPAEVGRVVVVQSGDTLTSIAHRVQPKGDVSALVDRLARSHGPAPLRPGERLVVTAPGS